MCDDSFSDDDEPVDSYHSLNMDNISTIHYPSNYPVRDYQLSIVQSALYTNTLVSLPTGLGKTFIAAALILNYYRWFNSSKIIFMAPTRPLVAQQIKACYEISGVPLSDTTVFLNKQRKDREDLWNNHRVFFTTPQVVENDIRKGLVDGKTICLLVLDEAHHSKGGYAYSNVIKLLNEEKAQFRVLALSATPGADVSSMQEVIDNSNISQTIIKSENDPDVAKYLKSKKIKKIDCEPSEASQQIVHYICEAVLPVLKKCNEQGIYPISDPARINHFMAMQAAQSVSRNSSLSEGIKWSQYFQLMLLGSVGQMFQALAIYGVKAFYELFIKKKTEFETKWACGKSKNKLAYEFWYHKEIIQLNKYVDKYIHLNSNDKGQIYNTWSHTKFKAVVNELKFFYSISDNNQSKCIIFANLRYTALEIVKTLEDANKHLFNNESILRPHIFLGQSKETVQFEKNAYIKKNATKKKQKEMGFDANFEIDESKDYNNGYRISERVQSSIDAHEKGLTQTKQSQIIKDFNSSKYNILVSTSIGEEGLDIGEVDLIINFDSTGSVIKNLQRIGRTGRKRDGNVILLFSGKERDKYEEAQRKYKWLQDLLRKGSELEYHKSLRLIPIGINPVLKMVFVEPPNDADPSLGDLEEEELMKRVIEMSKNKDNRQPSIDWLVKKGGFNNVSSLNKIENSIDIEDNCHKKLKKRKLDLESKVDFSKLKSISTSANGLGDLLEDSEDDLMNIFGNNNKDKEINTSTQTSQSVDIFEKVLDIKKSLHDAISKSVKSYQSLSSSTVNIINQSKNNDTDNDSEMEITDVKILNSIDTDVVQSGEMQHFSEKENLVLNIPPTKTISDVDSSLINKESSFDRLNDSNHSEKGKIKLQSCYEEEDVFSDDDMPIQLVSKFELKPTEKEASVNIWSDDTFSDDEIIKSMQTAAAQK
ncbi:3'-5' DNA helicase [Martiniozyma asiatica (nom. inval.)]|nr:3'-5' DNA helicase [Martiniozyma asiatica]